MDRKVLLPSRQGWDLNLFLPKWKLTFSTQTPEVTHPYACCRVLISMHSAELSITSGSNTTTFNFSPWKLNATSVPTISIPISKFSKGYSQPEQGMKATTNTASLSSFHYITQGTSKSIMESRAVRFDSRDAEKLHG